MDWKLEVVIAPVSDVERAREFYAGKLGFPVDSEHRTPDGSFHVVQVTPPGSACSIIFGKGIGGGPVGTLQGATIVVDDIEAAHQHLEEQGVENSGIQHFVDGVMTPGPDPQGADYNSFVFFDDPDGNTWSVQHVVRHAR